MNSAPTKATISRAPITNIHAVMVHFRLISISRNPEMPKQTAAFDHPLANLCASRRALSGQWWPWPTHPAGPEIRRNLFELVGVVELAMIAVGREVDMVVNAGTQIARNVPMPDTIASAQEAVKDIRDAYEHIDERAARNIWRRPHPGALTIFDWRRLIVDGVIIYGPHELDPIEQLPALLSAMRKFFKDAAADG